METSPSVERSSRVSASPQNNRLAVLSDMSSCYDSPYRLFLYVLSILETGSRGLLAIFYHSYENMTLIK